MNHTGLINYLIYQRKAKRYLEISVHDKQQNFTHVLCSHKVSTAPATSVESFIHTGEEFDLIYIDGIHTEEQALKDIENAHRCLAKDGIIIIHDCMPPDAWHQREPEEFREGENWNGTVWKATLRIFNNSAAMCSLLDTDWGCGIIDKKQTQVPKCRPLPGNLDYDVHYPWLLEYKKSVAVYLREDVKVFYHLACIGNWQEVFNEQARQLYKNGFQQANITVLGTAEDIQTINLICEEQNIRSCIVFHAPDPNHFETPALLAIEEYARQTDGFVLYLHSKGVSSSADETKKKWRRLMMYELVENWEQCMLQLPHYDAVGVNWRDMPPTSHFCGNFWYASTSYLRTLADFRVYYNNPRYRIWDRINDKRLGCEFWISSGKSKPRVLSLFCRNVDFCNHYYWKDK